MRPMTNRTQRDLLPSQNPEKPKTLLARTDNNQMKNKNSHGQHQVPVDRSKRLILACLIVVSCLYLYTAYKINNVALQQQHAESSPQRTLAMARTILNNPQNITFRSRISPLDPQDVSSVDYMACCGAGHRVSKLSEAHYLSKQLGFGLRVFWGYCDTLRTRHKQTEVFHFLFGTFPLPMHAAYHRHYNNVYARINNDVPGFNKLIRNGDCSQCDTDKAITDQYFYETLREQFSARHPVLEEFRRRHFEGRRVVGVHIRAGNGEVGDFEGRNRTIPDDYVDTWMHDLSSRVRNAIDKEWGDEQQNKELPVTLFVATDTARIVVQLTDIFEKEGISVIHWKQTRPTEGSGVLFGEQGKVSRQGEACLRGWTDTFMDMMIISYSDILIAARPSSFTQGLPMSLVYANGKTFCEVNPDASEIQCFKDFSQWCCEGRTKFSLEGIKQKYDYLRMPGAMDAIRLGNANFRKKYKIEERPLRGCEPHEFSVSLPYIFSYLQVSLSRWIGSKCVCPTIGHNTPCVPTRLLATILRTSGPNQSPTNGYIIEMRRILCLVP